MYVTEELETISLYQLEGPLHKIIEMLQEIKDRYPDKKLTISKKYCKYDDGYEYILSYKRPENQDELNSRLAREKQNEEYRRQQYENLKKEFESK